MATSLTQEDGDGTYYAYPEWINVQRKTFTNWVNEKLRDTPCKVQALENDLDDGVTLIKLLETLAKKKIHKRYSAKPIHSFEKSENLEIALEFMKKVENIRLENIGVSDIISHNLTLILALVWALILHYQVTKGRPHAVESEVVTKDESEVTADELLLQWMKMALPENNIQNLTSSWSDGRNLAALVNYCQPGLIANHASLDPNNPLKNVQHAMTMAEQHLNIPQVMHPEDLAVDHPDKLSTMTYLSQFWWRSRIFPFSFEQDDGVGDDKQIPEGQSFSTVNQLENFKQQTKRELQKQFDSEMHLMITEKDEEASELKKQLKSLRRDMETEKDEHSRQLAMMKKALEKELEYERLSKQHELLKRNEEITEHKKKLELVKMELETVNQKLPTVQKEQSIENESHGRERFSLQAFNCVEPALRKNHMAYFRGFFLLRTSTIINGKPAQVGPNEEGWLTLRCSNTNAAVTFDDFYTRVTEVLQNFSGIEVSNYWVDEDPLFQLNVSSSDSLHKLIKSKSKLQRELTSHISQLFEKKCQVQLQPQVFLILPSISGNGGTIAHVTCENAAQSMMQWEGSAAFRFQEIFQQWNDHSRKNEPTLGNNCLREVVEALEEVVEWFQFGIHLEIPHYELSIIKADYQNTRRCKTEMMLWWLKNSPKAKWSTIVQALVKTGMRALAHMIAQDHGVPTTDFSKMSKAAKTVEPPPDMGDASQRLREMVEELKAAISEKDVIFVETEQDLNRSQQRREVLSHEVAEIREKMESAQKKIGKLVLEKDTLERGLKMKELEIEILLSRSKSSIVTLNEQVSEYKKQLEFVRKELDTERKKMLLLQEELQRKIIELETKSVEIQFLREGREKAILEVKMEKERADMMSRKLAAEAISHAVYVKEVQMQLESLKEKKQHNDQVIEALQKTVRQKDEDIQKLSQQIATKKGQAREETHVQDAIELQLTEHTLELQDMKISMIEFKEHLHSLQTAVKLAREEASYYKNFALTLQTSIHRPTKDNPLFQAARSGDVSAIRTLMDAHVNVNSTEEDGRTALYLASQNGHVDVVELLLQNNAKADTCSRKNWWTPLIAASFNGHVEVVTVLIKAGANTYLPDMDGWTALHKSSQQGHVKVVCALIEASASVDQKTEDGRTALYLASMKGHVTVVQLLLQKHANVHMHNKNGWTALMIASFNGHVDVVHVLIEADADIHEQDRNGFTALHMSSQDGQVEVVHVLIEANVRINQRSKDGSTPLYLASQNGHVAVVKLLLQRHADVNISNVAQRTPLVEASFNGHVSVVNALLEAHADIHLQDKNGMTALHMSSQAGHFDVVHSLIEAGARVNQQAKDGKRAIDLAKDKGHMKIVHLLLQSGAQSSRCKQS